MADCVRLREPNRDLTDTGEGHLSLTVIERRLDRTLFRDRRALNRAPKEGSAQ